MTTSAMSTKMEAVFNHFLAKLTPPVHAEATGSRPEQSRQTGHLTHPSSVALTPTPSFRSLGARRGNRKLFYGAEIRGAHRRRWFGSVTATEGGKSPHLVELEVADDPRAFSHERRGSPTHRHPLSRDNRLWSTERLRGELLRLAIV
jgi:hypothetical protein